MSRQNQYIAKLSLRTPKFAGTGLVSYFRHIPISAGQFSIILVFFTHFDKFHSDFANLHSGKVVFWGRDRFGFHTFLLEAVLKNENCCYFLKV